MNLVLPHNKLTEKMIYLSGFIPHEEIKIEISGLRPGEKLFEEVLKDQEDLLTTHNDKIMIGKVMKHNHSTVNSKVTHLLDNDDNYDNQNLVDHMRELVPEFHSQNSYYTNQTLQTEEKIMAG